MYNNRNNKSHLKILVTGASGFIGSYITAALIKAGYDVICAVREPTRAKLKFPQCKVIYCDMNSEINKEVWKERLKGIEIVVNVVGLLRTNKSGNIETVHTRGTKALFDACNSFGVKKIIHISALGIDDENETEYSRTKREADRYLTTFTGIDWVVLQPSLVYASGCYGGTSLLRGIATLPLIPLVGNGEQLFQPVHIDDLTDTVLFIVGCKDKIHKTIKVVGPEPVSLKNILSGFRSWLGLKPTRFISIPRQLVKIACKLGDIFGAKLINSTSFKMLEHGNTASVNDFTEITGIKPKKFEVGLAVEPLTIQSLWHARLYFIRPILKYVLAFFWVYTGLSCLLFSKDVALSIFNYIGIEGNIAYMLLLLSCSIDIALGVGLFFNYKIVELGIIQIILVIGYTVFLSIFYPVLWLDPLGSLSKNLLFIVVICVMISIEREK